MKAVPMIGRRFGRLLVKEQADNIGTARAFLCKCDCGGTKVIRGHTLRSGSSTSCGCFHKEQLATRSITHGHAKGRKHTRTYRAYNKMIERCYYQKSQNYPYYGGLGIKVCKRWKDSFENFLEDMGECPKGLTLDRRNNWRGYSKNNCRWATKKEQSNNRRPRGSVMELILSKTRN